MCRIKNTVSELLPRKTRNAIRPIYRSIFDRSSKTITNTLEIGFFSGFEIAYRKGTCDERILANSFDTDIFFSGTPEYTPVSGNVIIDVGAHIGTFSLFAASKVKNGLVYAIEACRESYNLIKINSRLNNVNNIKIFNCALSDKMGTCTLHYDVESWGHNIVAGMGYDGEVVQCQTLEDFMNANFIERCHFMKLNCEGAEFPIVLGAPKSTLSRFKVILILYHSDIWTKNTAADLIAHLQSSTFETTIRNQEKHRGWIIAQNKYF
jgi:FkbM family methyltransferase